MAKTTTLAAADGCTYWCDGHLCDRSWDHCGPCLCRCGHRWTLVSRAFPPPMNTRREVTG